MPYGRAGPFSINIWIRQRPQDVPRPLDNGTTVGGAYEYFLTQANLQPLSDTARAYDSFDRNQVGGCHVAPALHPW